MFEKKCAFCEKVFYSKGKRPKFCSVSCALSGAKPQRDVTCVDCGLVFTYFGRGRILRCVECRKKIAVIRTMSSKKKRVPTTEIGVGSGGRQWGIDNHQWKSSELRKSTKYKSNYRVRCFKVWEKQCVVCSSNDEIDVHHINGNADDYSFSNLIPLCSFCHGKIHRKRWGLVEEYEDALFSMWINGRLKIAEKTGKSGDGQSEVKVSDDQPQRLEDEIIPPRGRDTER